MNDLVTVQNNCVLTHSTVLAEVLCRRHDNVVQSIRTLVKKFPNEFRLLNFKEADFIDKNGGVQPAYNLTKTGCTYFLLKSTDKVAVEFTISYIAAFEEMEKKLSEPPALPRYTVDELREGQLRAYKDMKPMFDRYLTSNSWERAHRREYLFAWMAYLGIDENHPLHVAMSANDAELSMKEMKKVGWAARHRALPVPASLPSDRVDAPLYLGKAKMKELIWATRPDLREPVGICGRP